MEIQHKLAAFCCLLYTRIVATTAKKSPQTELIFIQLFQMFLLNKPLSTLKNPWQVSHMRFSSLRFFNDANSLYEIFINTPSHLLLLGGSAGKCLGRGWACESDRDSHWGGGPGAEWVQAVGLKCVMYRSGQRTSGRDSRGHGGAYAGPYT